MTDKTQAEIEEFRARMEKQHNKVLYNIWNTEHRDEWTDQEFRIVGEILQSRGESIPIPKTEQIENIIATTTGLVDGKNVKQYLGVVSSSVVLGTGLLSEFGGGIADILGTRASGFQNKLEQARMDVLDEVKLLAVELSGDGLIGIEFDYMSLIGNLLMVSASGTAVRFSEDEVEKTLLVNEKD